MRAIGISDLAEQSDFAPVTLRYSTAGTPTVEGWRLRFAPDLELFVAGDPLSAAG